MKTGLELAWAGVGASPSPALSATLRPRVLEGATVEEARVGAWPAQLARILLCFPAICYEFYHIYYHKHVQV